MEDQGGVGWEGVARAGLGLRDNVEAAGEFGGGVDEAVGGDNKEGGGSRVGDYTEPVVEEREEGAGRG